MPLPPIDSDDDKGARGRTLIVGGSLRVPGAVHLAGVAALRSGAGVLQLATARDAAVPLGLSLPEALVVGLPRTPAGEIAAGRALRPLAELIDRADAVLVGSGMMTSRSMPAFLASLVRRLSANAVLVLDAAAIFALRRNEHILNALGGRAVITPHDGEMATLLGVDKSDIEDNRSQAALLAAQRYACVVALKGAETWIAAPDGTLLCYRDGPVGLATSGSGDTLAGIVAGLAARGASATAATAWAVWAHGTAGGRLSRRTGRVGFLARELLAELPPLLGC
jgi:hydroxyethylthiazole kinase-like uncharacterized protein yjeF